MMHTCIKSIRTGLNLLNPLFITGSLDLDVSGYHANLCSELDLSPVEGLGHSQVFVGQGLCQGDRFLVGRHRLDGVELILSL